MNQLEDACACCLVRGVVTAPLTMWKGTPVCSWHLVRSVEAAVDGGEPHDPEISEHTLSDLVAKLRRTRDESESDAARELFTRYFEAAEAGERVAADVDGSHTCKLTPEYVYVA